MLKREKAESRLAEEEKKWTMRVECREIWGGEREQLVGMRFNFSFSFWSKGYPPRLLFRAVCCKASPSKWEFWAVVGCSLPPHLLCCPSQQVSVGVCLRAQQHLAPWHRHLQLHHHRHPQHSWDWDQEQDRYGNNHMSSASTCVWELVKTQHRRC